GFKGSASVARDATMEWRLAVTVVDVQPNGNLVVEGRHTVTVDNQERVMVVTGIVRPLDVTTDNVVLSENVANASVRLIGDGPDTRTTERGVVGQIVHFIIDNLWPF
ncbi:MAG: flagellar basal body L-ring protein FlgH, partial [Planctomycetota bacterium]